MFSYRALYMQRLWINCPEFFMTESTPSAKHPSQRKPCTTAYSTFSNDDRKWILYHCLIPPASPRCSRLGRRRRSRCRCIQSLPLLRLYVSPCAGIIPSLSRLSPLFQLVFIVTFFFNGVLYDVCVCAALTA